MPRDVGATPIICLGMEKSKVKTRKWMHYYIGVMKKFQRGLNKIQELLQMELWLLINSGSIGTKLNIKSDKK